MGWLAGVHLGPARPLQDLPPFLSGLARLKAQSAGLTDRLRRSFSRRVYFYGVNIPKPFRDFLTLTARNSYHQQFTAVTVTKLLVKSHCVEQYFAWHIFSRMLKRSAEDRLDAYRAEMWCGAVLSELKPKKPPPPSLPPYGFDPWRNKRKEATHESSQNNIAGAMKLSKDYTYPPLSPCHTLSQLIPFQIFK